VKAVKQLSVRLARDKAGVTAVVIGLSMTALMGFAGLAVDVGLWYNDARTAQGAVDSAAYSAAIDYAAGDNAAGVAATAEAITAQYGLTNGAGGVTVTVNQPPLSGTHTTTAGAVEVIVHKTETRFFASFFMNSAAISARAVAAPGTIGNKCGVLALDPTASTSVSTAGISITNGANLNLGQCGVSVNATGADALYLTGGAKLTAQTVTVSGNYSISNGASMTVSGSTKTSAPPTADPYAGTSVPAPSGCTANNASYGGGQTRTISPGTYCNGLAINGGAHITMNPGVYIIDRGTFDLEGGATLNATAGVTIVLTSSTGSNYATATVGNGTTINLTAPTSGTTAGMAFFQDPRASSSGTDTFAGGATTNITGALYFPSQTVSFSNGTSNASSCTQLISYRVQYTGGSKFGSNCTGTGVKSIGGSSTALVE
jgi:hypothetical protein